MSSAIRTYPVSRSRAWIAHALTFLIAVQPAVVAQSNSLPSAPAEGEEVDLGKLRKDLRELYRAVDETIAAFPREKLDPAALAAKLGGEPEAALEFVRERTSLVPYSGVLRGARGVLMDGTGNSADRALFLAALIDSERYELRLARAQLDPTLVEQVLLPLASRSFTPLKDKASGDEAAALPNDVRGVLDAQRLLEEIATRTAEQSAHLLEVVVPHARPISEAARRAKAAQALADHWWVQARTRAEGAPWKDFDPALTDDETHAVQAPAGATYPPSMIPEELFHELDVRVVVTRQEDGGGVSSEQVPLEHTVRTAEQYGQHLKLAQVPLRWPKQMGLLQDPEKATAKVTELAAAQREWLPTLIVGNETLHRASYDADGVLNENPQRGTEGQKFQDAQRAVGGLGADTSSPANGLAAVHVEYVVRTPRQSPRTYRRPLYVREGGPSEPAARDAHRGLALLETVEILPTGGRVPPEATVFKVLEHIRQNRTVVAQLLNVPTSEPEERPGQLELLLGRMDPLPLELFSLATLRQQLHPHAGRIYQQSTAVFTSRRGMMLTDSRELAGYRGVDIVENPIEVRPSDEPVEPRNGQLPAAFRHVLVQGVLDSVIEAKLLVGKGPRVGASDFMASERDLEWMLVGGQSGQETASGRGPALPDSLPANSRAEVAAQLAAGTLAYVAERPAATPQGEIGMWWRVDPRSGASLAMSGPGRGASEDIGYLVITVFVGLSIITAVLAFMGCWNSSSSDSKLIACGICGLFAYAAAMLTLMVGVTPALAASPAVWAFTWMFDTYVAMCFVGANWAF